MMYFFVAVAMVGITLVGCTRSIDPEKTVVNLRMPSVLPMSAKADAMAAFPSNRKLCYAINVLGSGIESHGDPCGATRGMMLGFVESGGSASIELKPGPDRSIQLFAFLKASGDTAACPPIPASFKDLGVKNVFKVAEIGSINVSGDEMIVPLHATFPGMNQSLAHTMTLPQSCIPVDPSAIARQSPRVQGGGGVVQTSTHRLRSRIGLSANTSRIEAGRHRLHQ